MLNNSTPLAGVSDDSRLASEGKVRNLPAVGRGEGRHDPGILMGLGREGGLMAEPFYLTLEFSRPTPNVYVPHPVFVD